MSKETSTAQLQEKREVIQSMEKFVAENLNFLKPIEEVWQPCDFLPPMDKDNWQEGIEELRKDAQHISNELLVVLVGNMITEEALPSYETWINGLEGIGQHNGISENPWAQWARGWTAEENRHGEIINTYLYLSGRVDVKKIAQTIQFLIRNGFDPNTGQDPYFGLVYTSFQERATKIAHGNTGRMALKQGSSLLSKMCAMIAGDEARHEDAYKTFFKKVLELDPNRGVLAFAEMMKRKIIMPAKNMSDGVEKQLFIQHIVTAQRQGVYTAENYSEVIRYLVDYWDIGQLSGLNAEASEAQEYLCQLADYYKKKAPKLALLAKMRPKMKCSWIFDQKI